jgi:hypothetical protein
MKSYNKSISFILYDLRSLEGLPAKFLEVLWNLSVAMIGMNARDTQTKKFYNRRDVTNVVYTKS